MTKTLVFSHHSRLKFMVFWRLDMRLSLGEAGRTYSDGWLERPNAIPWMENKVQGPAEKPDDFKLKYNEKYTIFLHEFITKIIFISKCFNYNIHFLNIVSVRWRPLLSIHSCKCFWKFYITRCSMVGEIAVTSSLMFCFKSTVVLGVFSYTLLLRYPQRKRSQALRSSDLAGRSIFPLREISWVGNISLRILGKWPTWCTNSFLCIYFYL